MLSPGAQYITRGSGVLLLRGSLKRVAVVTALLDGGSLFAFSVVSLWAGRSNFVVMSLGDAEVVSQVSF